MASSSCSGWSRVCLLAPVANGLRIGLLAKDLLPDIEISGDVGSPFGSHWTRVKRTRRSGAWRKTPLVAAGSMIGAAEVFVEALQASAFGEVLALRLADAGQDIEVCGEPAVVLGEETGNELAGIVGACSGQISPGDLGPGSSGNDDPAGANADLASVEIEGGGVGEQSSESGRPQQGEPGFGIVLGQCPVETGYGGIVYQHDPRDCYSLFSVPR